MATILSKLLWLFISIPHVLYASDEDRDYILVILNGHKMDWNAAENYCVNTYESHLASVLTQRDYSRAYNYSYFSGFIGLNDQNEHGKYQWVDGTPCDHPANSPLCSEYFHPKNGEEHCSIIPWGGHKSEEYECDKPFTQFFCNKVRSYVYVPEAKSYQDAEQFCVSEYGTHLATITRQLDINNALNKIIKSNKNAWVGLYQPEQENVWLDGTEFEASEHVALQSKSKCRSFEYNKSVISDNHECDELLPFLCNKRVKPRQYILGEETNVTFERAMELCKSKYQSELATVITEEEFSDAMDILPEFEVAWMGLQRVDGAYKWLDGTKCSQDSADCISYWNEYDKNEPNYECGMLWQNGRAKSRECTETATYYICNQHTKLIDVSAESVHVKTEM